MLYGRDEADWKRTDGGEPTAVRCDRHPEYVVGGRVGGVRGSDRSGGRELAPTPDFFCDSGASP